MDIPRAMVKDLRSTGYFYNELKNYSNSQEIDLETYCATFAVPYLIGVSEYHERSGRLQRGKILRLAIMYLSNQSEFEIMDSIFVLKKIAESESDKASKAIRQQELNKSLSLKNREKLESAEFLIKILVTFIKMFRLAKPNVDRVQDGDEVEDPVFNDIIRSWENLENADVFETL